ncbi:hypothetical protein [Ruminiclostridium cellobioparum]|uniref:Uncharacterized protein n=1 Tax=Ruminiclostridium cellobioparum subsp. termitidis CT1112 TaxID=1195236 RepID=S0FT08_RUMCE|nr:hypothetical protein [Ruminiclostridium cellobioparum]EMS73466.1 hypothetical protein CTER_0450 [Ruminiclostridium cellobioparum subsp. termitidis CT1112]
MFTTENFIRGLQNAFHNIQVIVNENKLLISRFAMDGGFAQGQNELLGEIPLTEIQAVVDDVTNGTTFNDYILYKKVGFEVAIKAQDRMKIPSYRFFDRDQFLVSEHNYELLITKASSQYIIALMCFSSSHSDINLDLPPLYRTMMRDGIFKSLEELSDLFRIMTAKIAAPVECSLSEFKRMLQSYLFNISYNRNIVFSVVDLSENRQPMRRSVRRGGQLFPYKSYNAELVKYYYQGASTDIPFTQYLAFYHVAEFFFQTIAEQEAFQEIESFITRPSFSPYKKEDIRLFYNKIKKKMRDQREDGVWDEKTGLLLCLKKFIPNVEVLKNAIHAIDSSAIDYYKNNNVLFADEGKIINFDDISDVIYVAIRNRVYSVRNAIVHSKEGEKLRYEPFKHDKDLSKEIPLIRAIAEEIIINSAKPMEIKYGE